MADGARRALASLVVGTLLVTGSIGAVGATTTGAGGERPLTRKQWIRASNRICRAADRKIEALPPTQADPLSDVLTPADFAELTTLFQGVVTITNDALVELRALRPPKQDRLAVREILGALRESKARAEIAIAAARAQEQEVFVAAFRQIGPATDEFEARAKLYGSRCGRSSEVSG